MCHIMYTVRFDLKLCLCWPTLYTSRSLIIIIVSTQPAQNLSIIIIMCECVNVVYDLGDVSVEWNKLDSKQAPEICF